MFLVAGNGSLCKPTGFGRALNAPAPSDSFISGAFTHTHGGMKWFV